MKKWFDFYSMVKPWMEEQRSLVDTQEFVVGLWGLKRNLPKQMAYEQDADDLKRQAGNCVDAETEILTAHGWCKYYDLNEGDQILSFNMSTHQLERDVVKRVNVYTHGRYECVEFRHPSLSAVTTLNHRWPVYTPRDSNSYHFVTTQDMSTKSRDQILRCATGLRAGYSTDIPESPIHLEESHYRLLGWLLTDGSMKGTKNIISQSLTANLSKCERIEQLLNNTGLSYTKKIKNKRLCGGLYQIAYFYVHKCPFMDWVRQLVTDEYALRPEFIFTLSMEQARWIIEEMILGDGCVNRSHITICCGNKTKADSLQLIACTAGFGSSSKCETGAVGRRAYGRVGNSTGYAETKKPYYRVSLLHRDKAHIYSHHRHPKVVDTVWCPTTGNGTWVARRNGKVYITGNSSIQSFASDFNCFLMLIVMEQVREKNLRHAIRMVNTVHDSIVFEVKSGYEKTLAYFYTDAMKQMNDWCSELFGKEYYINMRGDLEIGLTYGDLYEAKVNPETYEVTLDEIE